MESQKALGSGERYHANFKNVYGKIRDDVPTLDKSDAQKLATKSVNETAGPSGLVPTLLVIGMFPRLLIHPKDVPEQRDIMRSMQLARTEMAQVMAPTRINIALDRIVPSATDIRIRIRDLLLVFVEKPINRWICPYLFLYLRDKSVFVYFNVNTTRFFIDKVNLYRESVYHYVNYYDEDDVHGSKGPVI